LGPKWPMTEFYRNKSLTGFTLLELMITIAIMAISLSLAVPALGDFIQNQRLRSDVGRLHMDLLYARSMAVNQGQQVIICAFNNGQTCSDEPNWEKGWIIFIDSNNDRDYQSGELHLRVSASMESLSARSSIHRRKIRFFPDGSAAGSAARITICDPRGENLARALVIANSGRIRMIRQSDEGIELVCS